MLDSFEEVSEFRSCPLYPNGISWAKKANMIASTAERVIYVLDLQAPERQKMSYVRCHKDPYAFRIGHLQTGQLPPFTYKPDKDGTMKRGSKPAFRAAQWSPAGCAVYGGHLLAASTTDDRLCVFRPPNNRLMSEWVEVACISDLLYQYYTSQDFDVTETITTDEAIRRLELLSTVSLDWSPVIRPPPGTLHDGHEAKSRVLLAQGGKRRVTIWQYCLPHLADERDSIDYRFDMVSSFDAHADWTTAVSWHPYKRPPTSNPWLVTGSTDGSVRLWELETQVSEDGQPRQVVKLLNEICAPDRYAVFTITWAQTKEQNIVIYGKGFGVGLTFLDEAGQTLTNIEHLDMHTKCITGITWHNDVLMTCSIDGYIKSWRVFRSEEELKVKLEQAESKPALSLPYGGELQEMEIIPMAPMPADIDAVAMVDRPTAAPMLQMGAGGNYPRRDHEVVPPPSLNYLPEHPLVRLQFIVNVAGDSGAFGLGLSPSSLYLACVIQTAANPDKMFSKRTPGGKLVFYCIDDKEEALHHAVENVLREEPPCSLWDVLKVLNERDEDHRIYLHLTAQLEAAFYKSISEGGLSGVDALATKLGKLKALKIANVLHMNVKKDFPPDSEIETMLEAARARNAHEIRQLWVWSILNEFYVHHAKNGENTALQFSPRERTSILLMCDWIVINFAAVPPPFHALALALYRFLSSVPSTLPVLPPAPATPHPLPTTTTAATTTTESDDNPRATKRGRTSKAAKESAAPTITVQESAAGDVLALAKQHSAEARRREMEEDRQREKELVVEFESEADQIKLLSALTETHGFDLAPAHLPARECCPICATAVRFLSVAGETCMNGHTLVRCMRTMLLLDRAGAWNCPTCGGKAQQLTPASFAWLQTSPAMVSCCPMCDSLVARSL